MASSVPELTPRAREIVATARSLLESDGPDALSMRRIADALGIKALLQLDGRFPPGADLDAAWAAGIAAFDAR
jgi:Bacterial regulatory proteins, tetR family